MLTIKAEQEAALSSVGEEVDAACCSLLKNGQRNLQVFMGCLCCAEMDSRTSASRPAGVLKLIQIQTNGRHLSFTVFSFLKLVLKAALTDGQRLVHTVLHVSAYQYTSDLLCDVYTCQH